MSTSTRDTPYHHGGLRQALLDAAMQALESGGTEALGLRELARAVGVSPAAPYRHFKSKAELLAAVATEGFRLFRVAQDGARDAVPELEQLGNMAKAYVRFAIDHPALFRLMFSAGLDYGEHPDLRVAADAAYAPLARAAAREDKLAPEQVALSAWAFVHGLSVLLLDRQIRGADPADAEALIEQLTGRFVFGLRAAG